MPMPAGNGIGNGEPAYGIDMVQELMERERLERNEAIDQLEAKLETLASELWKDKGTTAAAKPVVEDNSTYVLTYDDSVSLCEQESVYEVRETVWDILIFCGCGSAGVLSSAVMVLVATLVIILQGFILSVIVANLGNGTKTSLPKSALTREWRETVGHHVSNMVPATHRSLVNMMCVEDQSLALPPLVADLNFYLLEIWGLSESLDYAGMYIAALALFILFLRVASDIRAGTDAMIAVISIPRGQTRFVVTRGKVVLECVSLLRVAFLLLTNSVRCIIALGLLMCGGFWLARTTSVQDLFFVLMALLCVMETDRLLCSAFMPRLARSLVTKLEPLPMPKPCLVGGVGGQWFITLLMATVFISGICIFTLLPNVAMMRDLKDHLCSGYTDFVYGTHPETGVVYFADSEPATGVTGLTQYAQQAVNELIWALPAQTKSIKASSVQELQVKLSETMGDLADAYTCEDRNLAIVTPWVQAARASTGVVDAVQCSQLAGFCSDEMQPLVRLLCPVTCNCHDPTQPPLYTTGCPFDSCRAHTTWKTWKNSASIGSCIDTPTASITQTQAWISYWDGFLAEGSITQSDRDSLMTNGCVALTGALLKYCEDGPPRGSVSPFCPARCECWLRAPKTCPSGCTGTR